MKNALQFLLLAGVGVCLVALPSCSLMFGAALLTPDVQSSMATKAPLVTTADVQRQPAQYENQIIQIYGRITRLGERPCIDGLIDLYPSDRKAFGNLRLNQRILVRGYLRGVKNQNDRPLRLTSAVYYPGIEKGHEAALRQLGDR